MGKEKGEENVIFYCLVGVKRERKENMVDGVFHLGQPCFFLPNWKENGRGTSIEKKITRLLSTFLFIPLLYSKSIIIIYYPSFHFSILYTRHTWWKTQIFSIQEEDTEGMGFQWAHNFVFHPNWKEMRKRRESFVHRPT